MPIQPDSLTVTWIPGDGSTRVAYINTSNSFVDPANGSFPTANAVWQNAGQQAVYVGSGNQVMVTGLTQNTTYHVRVYEFNSNGVTTLYLTTASTDNPNSATTLSLLPTIQDSAIGFSNVDQFSAIVSWTPGNAANRVVYINSTNSFTNPTNGAVPSQNTVWANAGQQAIYVGSGNVVTVSGLSPSTTYYVRIYGFNGTGVNVTYLTTTGTSNPNSFTTSVVSVAIAPTVQDTGIVFSGFTNSSMTVTWTKGNGENRVLYLHTANTFTNPTNGAVPTADSSWNGAGQQAVYVGKGNGVQITGLTPNVTYFARVYGFNGEGVSSVYNTSGSASIGQQLFIIPFGSAGNTNLYPAYNSITRSIMVEADASASPLNITLKWVTQVASTGYTIYRKLKSSTSWGTAITTLPGTATQYVDSTVSEDIYYEYQVVRTSASGTAYGYVATGINLSQIDDRGKILLIVDDFYSSSLASELGQLEDDLIGDGWRVIRSDFPRSASVATIKNYIVSQYALDPTVVKSVFILGHIAVPYSGNIWPDGHPAGSGNHNGAWACDAYYGELNGTWTDTTVNTTTATQPWNDNVPGDGKFDQGTIPTSIELEIGRVDLYQLPAFASNDVELTRAYLNKAHEYKTKRFTSPDRGLMIDQLDWTGDPLLETGWRTMGPLVGSNNIKQLGYGSPFLTNANAGYLWTSSGGGGASSFNGYTDVNGGSTANYAATAFNGVFNTSIGSYFGDWDNSNNFLRAPLASGRALTNTWVGLPRWIFHHFAFNDHIGFCIKTTQNGNTLYPTNQINTYSGASVNTHIALMGDPTLRARYVEMPEILQITVTPSGLIFSWTRSADDTVIGYHIYRVGNTTTPHARITNSPISGVTTATFTNGGNVSNSPGTKYMIRAIRLEKNRSGSYYNASLGKIAIVP